VINTFIIHDKTFITNDNRIQGVLSQLVIKLVITAGDKT